MTNAQIVGLGVRLFSVWLALYVLRHVPSLWALNAGDTGDPAFAAVIAAVVAVLSIAAALLWIFPLTVARKMIPRTVLDQPTTLPVEQVETVGFCLLGLWLLAGAIPDAVYWAVAAYQSKRPESLLSLEARNYASMASTLVELVIGVWLLFGAKGLLGLLRWARTAGAGERS